MKRQFAFFALLFVFVQFVAAQTIVFDQTGGFTITSRMRERARSIVDFFAATSLKISSRRNGLPESFRA